MVKKELFSNKLILYWIGDKLKMVEEIPKTPAAHEGVAKRWEREMTCSVCNLEEN
jgi:hypothetical protein